MIIKILTATTILGSVLAPAAHADESSFVQAVSSDGLPVSTTTLALGHLICEDIISNGVAGVANQVRLGLLAGLSPHDVTNLVGDAVFELCPAGIPAAQAWAASHRTTST